MEIVTSAKLLSNSIIIYDFMILLNQESFIIMPRFLKLRIDLFSFILVFSTIRSHLHRETDLTNFSSANQHSSKTLIKLL